MTRYSLFTLTVVGCLLACSAAAQDTSYISQFVRQRNLQLNTWVTDVDFSISPDAGSGENKFTFTPNVKGQVGVSAGFKWFTLSLGVQVPGTEFDPLRYGHTQYLDFYFGGYKNQFGGEVYYRSFDGLFRNQTDYAPVTIMPDARLRNYGLTFLYVFKKDRFSMRSAISQQELQKKSAGSFVLFTNYNYRAMSADGSVIPAIPIAKRDDDYNDLEGLNDIRFYTFNIRPGYAHNFVIKNGRWFISPSAFVGLGVAKYEFRTPRGIRDGYAPDADAHAKLSAGYNNRLVFFNIYIVFDQNYTVFSGHNHSSALQTRSFGFNIGYRLNSFFKVGWL